MPNVTENVITYTSSIKYNMPDTMSLLQKRQMEYYYYIWQTRYNLQCSKITTFKRGLENEKV